jgi:hypothetical protein
MIQELQIAIKEFEQKCFQLSRAVEGLRNKIESK